MNDTAANDPNPMFSRSLLGGKKTERVDARVSDNLKEAIRRRWTDLGFGSESEYIEFLVTVDCFGVDHIRNVTDRRLSLVCALFNNGPTTGQ